MPAAPNTKEWGDCVVFVLCPVQTINQLTKPNEFEKEKRKNKIKIKAVHVELFTYQKATSQCFFFLHNINESCSCGALYK